MVYNTNYIKNNYHKKEESTREIDETSEKKIKINIIIVIMIFIFRFFNNHLNQI